MMYFVDGWLQIGFNQWVDILFFMTISSDLIELRERSDSNHYSNEDARDGFFCYKVKQIPDYDPFFFVLIPLN